MTDPKENKFLRYLDYFFIMRPTLFFPLWTFFLAGYYAAERTHPGGASARSPFFAVILLTLLMGAVFIVNQIVDEATDAKNDKLFFIAKGIISRSAAIKQATLLIVTTIFLASLSEIRLGVIFIVVAFFTGYLYSVKPFSWKDRPLLGLVTNFGGGWSIFVSGWLSSGNFNWEFAFQGLPYAIAIVAVFLLTTIPDIPGDMEVGKITFGAKYGVKKTTFWALIAELGCAGASLWQKEWILFFPSLAAMPLFLAAAIKNDEVSIARAIKFTVLFASLAVCVVFPVYFLALAANFYFSKWYYRKRFDLEYPKFAA
ncbi:MAG: UbiA family prenyltransferase [Calditrichaeota bacterium]|nr:UbiA family prenyltransferase [Calditrichota bacterium]